MQWLISVTIDVLKSVEVHNRFLSAIYMSQISYWNYNDHINKDTSPDRSPLRFLYWSLSCYCSRENILMSTGRARAYSNGWRRAIWKSTLRVVWKQRLLFYGVSVQNHINPAVFCEKGREMTYCKTHFFLDCNSLGHFSWHYCRGSWKIVSNLRGGTRLVILPKVSFLLELKHEPAAV